jgi:DnaJ homolog subfamily A member 2
VRVRGMRHLLARGNDRTGGKANAKPKKCPACSGTGVKVQLNMFNQFTQVVCGDCGGSGKKILAKDRCKKCKGEKLTEEKKPLEFWVEKGMSDGEQIVLKGEADQEPGKETGDVIFVLDQTEHPVFGRRGSDLRALFKISLAEALTGFSRVIITTLDGRGLKYTQKLESGKVIRPGEMFKIPGEGMPLGKKSDLKGDLYLRAEIEFPQDGFVTDLSIINQLRTILTTSEPATDAPTDTPEIIDEVTLEKVDEDELEEGWETESEGESEGMQEQCTTQ